MRLADIQDAIRQGRILAGPHTANGAGADLLTLNEVWTAILGAATEIIEDYPNDSRGPSCLIYCEVNGTTEHVVIAYPSALAAGRHSRPALAFMITCYRPGGPQYASQWSPDFKRRLP